MKFKQNFLWFGAVLLLIFSLPSRAGIVLYDYGFNIDGKVSMPILGDPVPAEVDISGFDDITGLGDITATISGAGTHTFDAFFDHEIRETNNSFFNEFGSFTGAPGAGQSWEIDEPGFAGDNGVLGENGDPYYGDIFDNFEDSMLDNQINYDSFDNQFLASPDDVSMAMGWDFTLGVDEFATISLTLSELMPTSGFYLSHTDPDTKDQNENVVPTTFYLSSSLDIAKVPEPSILLLFGTGLLGLVYSRRKLRH